MTSTTGGWIIFIAALGMMCGLMANDVSKLTDWNGALQPAFVGLVMAHFGVVVLAFVGGKLIPEQRTNFHERAEDKDEKN